MTETSLLWTDTGGDGGTYTQDELRIYVHILGGTNKDANVGVVGAYLNSLRPSTPGDNHVVIATGAGIVNGTPYENDAAVDKTITSPVVGTTGKRLVLRKDWAAKEVRITEITSADGTATIPALTQTDLTTWDVPLCSFTITTGGVIGALSDEREFTNRVAIPFVIDGGGAVIATGIAAGDIPIPRPLHLYGWEVLADQSGAIVVDVWADTYANYPPTGADSIAGTDEPEIVASGTKAQNLNIAGGTQWTVDLAAGQRLRFNVDSVTGITYATIILFGAG